MDSRERFTATVDAYEAARPDYPAALLAWLAAETPGRRVTELGSGTGILSRQLAAAGFDVVGVEPNAAMRAAAERADGGPRYVDGTAEATGLAPASADLVIGAQAFHWFDLARALPEIDRLLAPGGLAVAVWNVRRGDGFAAAYDDLITTFCGPGHGDGRAEPALAALATARPAGRRLAFAHVQRLDRAGAHQRAWSSSYVVHGVTDAGAFDAALDAIVEAHARDGIVELGYATVLWAWRGSDAAPAHGAAASRA